MSGDRRRSRRSPVDGHGADGGADQAATFLRGLTIGAIVGAMVAGLRIWTRFRRS